MGVGYQAEGTQADGATSLINQCVYISGGGLPVGPTPLSKCSNLVARMKDAGEEHGEAGFES